MENIFYWKWKREFQNVKIRGTLSTAVFEKESVTEIGGQLYIANSTALTGSVHMYHSAATMSVCNVGGFVATKYYQLKRLVVSLAQSIC